MTPRHEPDLREHVHVGAIWRRRKPGALVRIVALKNHASSRNSTPYYDIGWEAVEKPVRRGASCQDYWFKSCEPSGIPPESHVKKDESHA
jgi:hypothetical protein